MQRLAVTTLCLAVVCTTLSCSGIKKEPPDRDAVLEALAARDARMDGSELRFRASTTLTADGDRSWKLPQLAAQETPAAAGPVEVEAVYEARMASSGDLVVFVRELAPSAVPADPVAGQVMPLPYQKWSNLGNEVREITRQLPELSVPEDTIVDIYPGDGPAAEILAWQRLEIELAHGYGLGGRIDSADAVTATRDGWRVRGRLTVGPTREVSFDADVDRDHLVRRITLEAGGEGIVKLLIVTTSGTVTLEDVTLAARGEVLSQVRAVVPGAEPPPVTLAEWSSVTVDATLGLARGAVEDQARIDVPEGATLVRWDGDGEEGEEEEEEEEDEDGCPECVAGWITQQDLIGGLECEHGPEHDQTPACRAALAAGTFICKELDPVNGNCNCFQCQGIPLRDPFSITCEGEIRVYVAWCDVTDRRTDDQNCPVAPGALGVLRQERAARTAGPRVCDGANGQFQQALFCGQPDRVASLACKATNCSGVGAWTAVFVGRRMRCA